MPDNSMARADFVSSLIFFVLGIYMVAEGWSLPGAGGFIEPGGEPGRVPILLGVIVALCAVVLLVRSVSRHGHKLFENRQTDDVKKTGFIRTTLTAVGCSFYAVGLLGANIAGWEVMYPQATAMFLFLFIVGFEWEFAPELGNNRWVWLNKKNALAGQLNTIIFWFYLVGARTLCVVGYCGFVAGIVGDLGGDVCVRTRILRQAAVGIDDGNGFRLLWIFRHHA